MSEIRVGDIVMVVRPTPCCGETSDIGYTFKVVETGVAEGECNCCGATPPPERYADSGCDADCDADSAFPVSILLRIDPPSDEMKREQELENLAPSLS